MANTRIYIKLIIIKNIPEYYNLTWLLLTATLVEIQHQFPEF